MDSMNKHFEYMDSLEKEEENGEENEGKEEKEEKEGKEEKKEKEEKEGKKRICCSKEENYLMDQGMLRCKECLSIISNITNQPEWRYYGSGDSKSLDPTRCGMPVNSLLPESSVGSTVAFNSNTKTMNQIRKYQQWNAL